LFRRLEKGEMYKTKLIIWTYIVPIIADIDAGGNEEATYLLTKKWLRNVQSKSKIKFRMQSKCGHQDGKVTVPHEDFLAKINAIRYVF
jgi:isocitrate lyase